MGLRELFFVDIDVRKRKRYLLEQKVHYDEDMRKNERYMMKQNDS